jgi:hypothetical protein
MIDSLPKRRSKKRAPGFRKGELQGNAKSEENLSARRKSLSQG